LDDAAHAFSVEQQREFFEIFAALKSPKLSAKAAVYPGVTSYSPTFHVGHDAELINIWYSPDEADYLSLMHRILEVRLPDSYNLHFTGKSEIVDILALASFGIPRTFINMVSKILSFGDQGRVKIDRSAALVAIREQAELNLKVFQSIKSRISRYAKFIDVGEIIFASMINKVNQANVRGLRASSIGIQSDLPQNIDRVFGLMEYSGIIRHIGEVSQGDVGKFRRYQIHYANLIAKNALGGKTIYSVVDIVQFFTIRVRSKYPLSMITGLATDNQIGSCVLELPACPSCGTNRTTENQKFCMSCGKELISPSIYKEMLNARIDVLPITAKKAEKLIASNKFKTVGDIIIDDEQNLMSIYGIGPYWSKRIKNAAEEFVND
jgi:hypothetical protein